MLRLTLISYLILTWIAVVAQTGNLRDSLYTNRGDTLVIDSLPVISSTVRILSSDRSDTVSSENYTIHDNTLYWNLPLDDNKPPADSLVIQYRVFPQYLTRRYFHADTGTLVYSEEEPSLGGRYDIYGNQMSAGLIEFPRLDYGGSFSRGFSVGNNQSLVLNSALNLQMQGDIGDGIEIAAAISDNNIPIQPEGNTRQIQEFDKVFIQLRKAPHSIIAGDFDIRNPYGYFLNYHKKLKGVQYQFDSDIGESRRLSAAAGAAISKGKFARNTITPREGNQGPYKLSGAGNERFIIVLPATERVFLDGQLLQRGLEEDYVIDYNRGEVSFTRKRLITKDNRIIVEFEYAEQNYVRTHATLNNIYTTETSKFYLNLYSELDGKNATGDLVLDTEDKEILRQSGDDLGDALRSTIQTPDEGFSSNRIMYALKDTFVNGQLYPDILVYSTNPDSALYTANFSQAGIGNGNYILSTDQVANGRVYQWVAPDPVTGMPTGEYAPVAQLIAPESRQFISAGAEFIPSENLKIRTEASLSNFDRNRFSNLDDKDNTGLAFYNTVLKSFELPKDWGIELEGGHEFVQKYFRPLNPYRNAEFSRDWDIPEQNAAIREHLPNGRVRIFKPELGHLEYAFNGLYRSESYSGSRNSADLVFLRSGWRLQVGGSYLNALRDTIRTEFFRPGISLSKVFNTAAAIEAGLSFKREENRRELRTTGSLGPDAFAFDIYRAWFRNSEDAGFHWDITYELREDRTPSAGRFVDLTAGHNWRTYGFWELNEKNRINYDFSYRELLILRNDLTEETPGNTILGKLDYTGNLAKGALRLNNSYELGTGREPRVEYQYIEVQPGEGDYIWIDDGDGVEELNEFEIAPFPDEANYIRLSVLNDNFINTHALAYNQSVRLNLRPLLYGKKGIADFFGRFAVFSTIKFSRKTMEESGGQFWNPFYADYIDTALVSLQNQWRNILYFNQSNPSYDIQVGQTFLRQQIVQTIGLESRNVEEYFTRFRWNISGSTSLIVQGTRGTRLLFSERFQNRDYDIGSYVIAPELTYLLSSQIRLIGKYSYSKQQNRQGAGEEATIHDLKVEGNYRKTERFSIRSSLSFARVGYDSEGNSAVEFAMLEGLKPGSNVLWNLQFDVQLSKAILMTVSYDGRKTGENPVVHTGNAQVRASF